MKGEWVGGVLCFVMMMVVLGDCSPTFAVGKRKGGSSAMAPNGKGGPTCSTVLGDVPPQPPLIILLPWTWACISYRVNAREKRVDYDSFDK